MDLEVTSAKRIVIDLDGTITKENETVPYEEKEPNIEVISQLKKYRNAGFLVTIFTARNMRSFNGNVGLINKVTLPIITEWLDRHNVPYDEILIGKPWCGHGGFYVDDRAIRPEEFVKLDQNEIEDLLGAEAHQ